METDLNLNNANFEDMKQKHIRKIYPPRIILTVVSKTPGNDPVFKLPIQFIGCLRNNQLDRDIIFPLGIHNLCMKELIYFN